MKKIIFIAVLLLPFTVNAAYTNNVPLVGGGGSFIKSTSTTGIFDNIISTSTKVSSFAGLVGIGTTSPYAKLSINPVAGDGDSFAIGSSTGTKFVVKNSGNVGLGTSNPLYGLQVDNGNVAITNMTSGASDVNLYFTNGGGSQGFLGYNTDDKIFTLTSDGSIVAQAQDQIQYSSNAAGVDFIAATTLGFATGGATRIFVLANGNVGVGTTSPGMRFAIDGAGGLYNGGNFFNAGTITSTTTASSTIPRLNVTDVCVTSTTKCLSSIGSSSAFPFDPTTNYGAVANTTTTPIWFQGTPNSLMASGTIQARDLYVRSPTTAATTTFGRISGDVGGKIVFGTDPGLMPTSAFNVATFNFDGAQNTITVGAHGVNATQATAGVITYSSRGTSAIPTATQSADPIFILGARGYGSTAYSGGSRAAIQMIASQTWTDTNQGSYLTLETTPNNSVTRAEVVRIDQSGFVGIGSTTPWAQLSVNPNIIGTGPEFVVGSSTKTDFVVNNAGKVGVGTAAPLSKFHVLLNSINTDGYAFEMTGRSYDGSTDNANGVALQLSHNLSGNRQFAFGDTESGDGVRIIGNALDAYNLIAGSRQNLFLGTDSTSVNVNSALAVQTSIVQQQSGSASSFAGALGIGTSTPYAKLSIQSGASTGDAFAVATSSGNAVFGVDNDGHTWTSGPAPVVSSCGTGTGTVVGDDQSGVVTTATAATSCTVTFSKTYRKTPMCRVTDNSLVGFADVSSISTTAVTFGISSALTGGLLYYDCNYHQ